MPAGIIATIDGGFATVDFVNPALRGPKLQAVIDAAGPEIIQTITRDGPRRKYRMPVGNAKAAGLLDVDAQGNPTAAGAVWSAGHDTGDAAALVAADPNGPANGNTNWHTPVAEYTSENAYVGQVPNATVLHNRHQVLSGVGGNTASSFGGSAKAATSAELLETIDAYERDNPTPTPAPHTGLTNTQIANQLGQQTAALPNDPGSWGQGYSARSLHAALGDEDPADPSESAQDDGEDGSEAHSGSEDPANAEAVTEPEPSMEWNREALNTYASEHGVADADKLPNKQAVLDAINAAPKE